MKTGLCLWRLVCFSPGLYILGFVLSLFYSGMPLIIGLILREFFNALTGEAEVRFDVQTIVCLYLVTQLTIQASEQGYAATYVYLEGRVKTLVRKNVFEYILKDSDAATVYKPGEVINRIDDDVDGVVAPLGTSMTLFGHAIAAVIALGVMLSINPLITILAFLPILMIVVITKKVGERIQKYLKATRDATGNVTGFIGDVFYGVQAIKVATGEMRLVHRFDALSRVRKKAILKERRFNSLLSSMNSTAIDLATGMILILAAGLIRSGSFTLGDFALFVSYFSSGEITVSNFSGWLGNLLAAFKRAEVSLKRLLKLMPGSSKDRLVRHGEIYLRGPFPDVPHVARCKTQRLMSLEVEGLSYRYPDSIHGIEKVSLGLRKGTLTVITGRIGSGKTTFLDVLLGFLPKKEGEVWWNDRKIEDLATFFVSPKCAYAPQVPRLFSDTLKENILMGLHEDKADLADSIRLAAMEQDVEQLENGLDTLVGPRGVRLSGGQVQRTAAARMLVRDPELLVFDDLSSALDVETEKKLWERILQRHNITCLVVSHRRFVLRLADHIVVLRDGKAVAEGPLNQLLQTCDEIQQLWRGDFGERKS